MEKGQFGPKGGPLYNSFRLLYMGTLLHAAAGMDPILNSNILERGGDWGLHTAEGGLTTFKGGVDPKSHGKTPKR